jgi:futalosine hydrolase
MILGFDRVLIVTAVEAERAAVRAAVCAGLPVAEHGMVSVLAGGVGPAAAAASTATALAVAAAAGAPFGAVLSAGIAGGFSARVPVRGLVIGTESIAADLGAEGPDGFLDIAALGFGTSRYAADPALLGRLRGSLPGAVAGPILTVSTVTGTAASTEAMLGRHPDAAAEAMEGFGVASAAALAGVAFGELRAVSNPIGPRDRAAWRIPEALAALRDGLASVVG